MDAPPSSSSSSSSVAASSAKFWMALSVIEALVIAALAVTIIRRPPPPPCECDDPRFAPTLGQAQPSEVAPPPASPVPAPIPTPAPPPPPKHRDDGWPAICGQTFDAPTEAQTTECAQSSGKMLPMVSAKGGYHCACCKELAGGVTTRGANASGTWFNQCSGTQEIERWRCTEAAGKRKETGRCPNGCDHGMCL